MSALDPMIAGDGRPVYTALVKPMVDGTVQLLILVRDGPTEKEQVWTHSEIGGQEAVIISAALAATGQPSEQVH